jgi:hypothetical protein
VREEGRREIMSEVYRWQQTRYLLAVGKIWRDPSWKCRREGKIVRERKNRGTKKIQRTNYFFNKDRTTFKKNVTTFRNNVNTFRKNMNAFRNTIRALIDAYVLCPGLLCACMCGFDASCSFREEAST